MWRFTRSGRTYEALVTTIRRLANRHRLGLMTHRFGLAATLIVLIAALIAMAVPAQAIFAEITSDCDNWYITVTYSEDAYGPGWTALIDGRFPAVPNGPTVTISDNLIFPKREFHVEFFDAEGVKVPEMTTGWTHFSGWRHPKTCGESTSTTTEATTTTTTTLPPTTTTEVPPSTTQPTTTTTSTTMNTTTTSTSTTTLTTTTLRRTTTTVKTVPPSTTSTTVPTTTTTGPVTTTLGSTTTVPATSTTQPTTSTLLAQTEPPPVPDSTYPALLTITTSLGAGILGAAGGIWWKKRRTI